MKIRWVRVDRDESMLIPVAQIQDWDGVNYYKLQVLIDDKWVDVEEGF